MTKQLRGFALLTPERRKEIARKGGKSIPAHKRSFSTNPALAAKAGRKGGKASQGRKYAGVKRDV
jgi:uncharacterized protein